jgi:hypothetical protein
MATVSKSKIKRMKLEWKIRHLLDELGRDERDLVSAAIAPLSALGEVRALAHLWYLTAGGVFDEELRSAAQQAISAIIGQHSVEQLTWVLRNTHFWRGALVQAFVTTPDPRARETLANIGIKISTVVQRAVDALAHDCLEEFTMQGPSAVEGLACLPMER